MQRRSNNSSIETILTTFSQLTMREKILTLELLEKSLKLDPLKILPKEIILHILEFMNYEDLLNLKSVNNHYYNLVKDDLIWYRLYIRHYRLKRQMDHSKFEFYYVQEHKLDKNWKSLNYNTHATKVHSRGIYCVDVGDIIVCGGRDQLLKIFDLNGKLLCQLQGHTASVLCTELVPTHYPKYEHIPEHLHPVQTKNRIVTGSSDSTVGIWDACDMKLVTRFNAHREAVLNVSVYRNFETFATCSKVNFFSLRIDTLGSGILTISKHHL
eukprot:NODE_153_length_15389_cov_1.201439.p6 type:complete len:269 gc:universal NODE_153_length_15389_cov_1.201439:6163-5357(-)